MSEELTQDHQEALVPSDDLDEETLQDFFFLEKSRVAADRERVQLGVKAIEAQSAADQRLYEFQMAQLDKGYEDRRDRFKAALKIIWVAFVFVMLGAGALFYLLFAGNELQQDMAFELLKLLGAAVAGGGAVSLTANALKKASSMV